MVSVHGEPPFSISDRLPDPSILTRPDIRPLEVRLLAIDQEKRHTLVMAGLVYVLYLYAQEKGITHLFISGVQERLSLYEQLGFEQIGPPVSSGKAVFVPMVCQVSNIREKKRRLFDLWLRRLKKRGEDQQLLAAGINPLGDPMMGDEGAQERPAWEVSAELPDGKGNPVCLLPGPVT